QGLDAQRAKDAVAQTKDLKLSLELKEDKTYSLAQGMGALEGSWSFEGGTVTLKPTKGMGMTKEELLSKVPQEFKQQIEEQFESVSLKSDDQGNNLSGAAPGTKGAADLNFSKSAAEKK